VSSPVARWACLLMYWMTSMADSVISFIDFLWEWSRSCCDVPITTSTPSTPDKGQHYAHRPHFLHLPVSTAILASSICNRQVNQPF
jgi:hypothetical protein